MQAAMVTVELACNSHVAINRKGHIDSNAKRAFTRGQCHALALVLHRLTGWKLCGFYDQYEWDNGETPGHVVVQTPEGKYVDITGDNALAGWSDMWPDTVPHYMSEWDVLKLSTIDYCEPAVEAAYPYALTLAVMYGRNNVQL